MLKHDRDVLQIVLIIKHTAEKKIMLLIHPLIFIHHVATCRKTSITAMYCLSVYFLCTSV